MHPSSLPVNPDPNPTPAEDAISGLPDTAALCYEVLMILSQERQFEKKTFENKF